MGQHEIVGVCSFENFGYVAFRATYGWGIFAQEKRAARAFKLVV